MHRNYKSQLELLKLSPQSATKELGNLIHFLAQVSHCYPAHLKDFPQVSASGDHSYSI